MAQSGRIPAGIPTRLTCGQAVAQKQQYGASAMPSDTPQTLARGVKLNEPRLKRLEPVLMFGDDVFRRAGDEVGVAELRLDLGDFQPHPRDLLVKARPFRPEIDDAGERQRDCLAAHHKLKRAPRRGLRSEER